MVAKMVNFLKKTIDLVKKSLLNIFTLVAYRQLCLVFILTANID